MFELYVAITSKCNFQCDHCITSSSPRNKRWQLTPAEIGALCELVDRREDIVCLHFSGGEPTVSLDQIAIIKSKLKRNVEMAITTNGSLPPAKWNQLADIGFKYISISFDTFHKTYISLDRLLEFAEYFTALGSEINFNVVFSKPKDLLAAAPIKEKGFSVNFNKLIHGGNAIQLNPEIMVEEVIRQNCPSLHNKTATSSGAEKIVYLPGEGFTWCCGPLAFNKKAPDSILSPSFNLAGNRLYQSLKQSKEIGTVLEDLKVDISGLRFPSVCDLCTSVFQPIQALGGAYSIADLTSRTDDNFYLEYRGQDLKESELKILSNSFRILKVLTLRVSESLGPSINESGSSIQVESFNQKWIKAAGDFTRQNFYEEFRSFYDEIEISEEVAGLAIYVEKFGAEGKVYTKGGQIVGLLLYNNYDDHPALKKPTRHIGYWGYDKSKVSRDEAALIKVSWIRTLQSDLKPSSFIDCSIHTFNEKSIAFAGRLGFEQQLWRLERKRP